MPDFLTAPFTGGPVIAPSQVLVRLLLALLLGGVVGAVYRIARRDIGTSRSFTTTLVLLTVLIAMVTQVIGDNVARAFSLVGALSIVRFRTVVRDTQDTAYVIFAVAVGMSIGASDPWVAVIGIGVIALGAFLMRGGAWTPARDDEELPFVLHVRLGLGHDVNVLLGPVLSRLAGRRLLSLETARQGMAIDVSYRVALRRDHSPDVLVMELNRIDGVQSVALRRAELDQA
jgi:hypothetical protein